MSRTIKNSFIVFFHSPLMWVGTLCILLFPHVLLSARMEFVLSSLVKDHDMISFSAVIFRQVPIISFLFLAFLSYEYMGKIKNQDMLETVKVVPNGALWAIKSQMLVGNCFGIAGRQVAVIRGHCTMGICRLHVAV